MDSSWRMNLKNMINLFWIQLTIHSLMPQNTVNNNDKTIKWLLSHILPFSILRIVLYLSQSDLCLHMKRQNSRYKKILLLFKKKASWMRWTKQQKKFYDINFLFWPYHFFCFRWTSFPCTNFAFKMKIPYERIFFKYEMSLYYNTVHHSGQQVNKPHHLSRPPIGSICLVFTSHSFELKNYFWGRFDNIYSGFTNNHKINVLFIG